MSDGGYKIRNKTEKHFFTFAVVEWVDVFSRKVYAEIFMESLAFCQKDKGLLLYAYCILTNHVHLLASGENGNLSDILRDLKKFTSRTILQAIESNCGESRKSWMLPVFKKHGAVNSRNTEYQFWQQDNHPEECYGVKFTQQKLNYIHMNPVRAGIVNNSAEYVYSSAWNYAFQRQRGKLIIDFI